MQSSRRLEERLGVIETALYTALRESDPEQRGRMLRVLDRATVATRADYQEAMAAEAAEQKRSAFRLIPGSGRARNPGWEHPGVAARGARWTGRTQDHATRSAG